MRLQTRITITAVTIITAVSLSVGYGAITNSYQLDINRLDQTLGNASTQISNATDGQQLATALLIGSSVGEDLSVYFYDINETISSLQDGVIDLSKGLSHKQMLSAIDRAVTVTSAGGGVEGGVGAYRLRSVALADNELILLAMPTEQAEQTRLDSTFALIWYVLVADVASGLGLALLVRRDLRGIRALIRQTKEVSENRSVEIDATDKVSEVTELAVALQQMIERLQASQTAMKQFLGDASHELRTPLTTIRGYLDILGKAKDAQNSELSDKALRIMGTEAARMQELIDDLLLLAQLGEGATTKDLSEDVDFALLVSEQFSTLADLQPGRELAVAAEPARVRGSEELINRLVTNLVSNIRRHTPETAEVRVTLDARHGGAVLTVEDAGPGLNQSAYTNGPTHFQRFDRARARDHGGSGLGMSIMAHIVEVHGGTMQLEASSLGGLKTTIWLPLIGKHLETKPLLVDFQRGSSSSEL
ncbi:MAG: sensor histidine kinase [Micrococcales bacterium]